MNLGDAIRQSERELQVQFGRRGKIARRVIARITREAIERNECVLLDCRAIRNEIEQREAVAHFYYMKRNAPTKATRGY